MIYEEQEDVNAMNDNILTDNDDNYNNWEGWSNEMHEMDKLFKIFEFSLELSEISTKNCFSLPNKFRSGNM